MEEILASIRRIIENNETDRPHPVEPADHPEMADIDAGDPETTAMEAVLSADFAADASAADASAAEDTAAEDQAPADDVPSGELTAETVPEAAADRPAPSPHATTAAGVAEIFDSASARSGDYGLRRDAEDMAAEATAPAAISLADVAARIRAEPTAPIGTVLDDAAVGELHEMLGEETVTPALRSPASEHRRATEGLQAVARAMAAQAPEPAAPVATASAEQHREPAPHATAAGDTAHGAPTQLVSVDTGARVAASFDALSHAVASGNLRSFDEIAEDLLRPMLQTWLDDNLPTLVERLVREEIERVSRGPRR